MIVLLGTVVKYVIKLFFELNSNTS